MKTDWYKHLSDPQQRSERKEIVKGKSEAWQLLREVLQHRLNEVRAAQEGKTWDTEANWAFVQADYLGQVRMLREVIDLLTIEDE